MSRRKPSFQKADIKVAWKALEDLGQEPLAVKILVDGALRIVTRKQFELTQISALKETDSSEWDKVLNDGE